MIFWRALFFFLFLYITQTTAAAAAPPSATEFILLSCGASVNSNDTSGRLWYSDASSKHAALSWTSSASRMESSVPSVPYQTARFFRSPFTYTFQVSAGQKFLRLYFYPTIYSDFDASQSFFSLKANSFTLLTNYSAYLYSNNSSTASFVKEFLINVGENHRLVLNFSPNSNSFAFINGIEIVSIPDKLYFKGNDVAITSFDQLFFLNDNTALENLYRLNVGGTYVSIKDDAGMFRGWSTDDEYIYFGDSGLLLRRDNVSIRYKPTTPRYTAPTSVYTTARGMGNYSISLEWGFPVDSGFNYLLRLHFCEFGLEVTQQNQRAFTISINNQMVKLGYDVIYAADGPLIPIFEDYVVWVPDFNDRGKQTLRLSLSPYAPAHPKYLSALLNGLEIFKLNDTEGSLAAANPEPAFAPPAPAPPPHPEKKSGGSSIIYPVVGGVVVAVAAAVSLLILRRQRRKVKDSGTTISRSLPSDLCRYFSIGEIKTATRNFDDNLVVGRGGFGNVYKGLIDNAASTVAVKRLKSSSKQGAREFLTEIDMLSKLRHLHLVSLIGYCDDDGEMILVYDYMAHGTLRDHLYNSENPPLTWKRRLQICLGAAKGLDYLHTGGKHSIIHRDVKSTNILLDEKWVAKMSDFGLSKVCGQTHVSTVVKGSLGYVDPEYYRRQQLTLKSDVYSFGVVLLEVVCARPAIIPGLPREQVNLGEWAKFCLRKGTVDQIIDSNLDGQIAPECLSKFVETAVACVKDRGIDRPSMNDVIWSLEFAMQLQVSAESTAVEGVVALSPSVPLLGDGASTEETFSRSKSSEFSTNSSEKCKSGDAFSELMNPTAR